MIAKHNNEKNKINPESVHKPDFWFGGRRTVFNYVTGKKGDIMSTANENFDYYMEIDDGLLENKKGIKGITTTQNHHH